MKKHQKILLAVNLIIASAIFMGNYFYLTEGGLLLKSLCSSGFALMGLINLGYAIAVKSPHLKFHIAMAIGLVFACLGDIVIGDSFILGAALFAIGHICYFISYCIFDRLRWLDLIISGVIFLCAGVFVMFCPLLEFPNLIMQLVCLVYALIISLMVGKAIAHFIRHKSLVTAVIFIGSVLFFFSDLMLVFDWFMNMGQIAGRLCMATYYPAECLLAFSSFLGAGHLAQKDF